MQQRQINTMFTVKRREREEVQPQEEDKPKQQFPFYCTVGMTDHIFLKKVTGERANDGTPVVVSTCMKCGKSPSDIGGCPNAPLYRARDAASNFQSVGASSALGHIDRCHWFKRDKDGNTSPNDECVYQCGVKRCDLLTCTVDVEALAKNGIDLTKLIKQEQ
jgi:hypothetical protein